MLLCSKVFPHRREGMNGYCRLAAAAGMLLFMGTFIGTAGAATIYNNFNSGNGYDTGTGWTVSGATSDVATVFSTGMAFTPSGTFTLTQIDVALNFFSGTNSGTLTLNSDSGGAPGGVLETWSLSSLPAFGACCTVETVTPVGSIVLNSGTQYWIVASATASDTHDAWMFNTTGALGFKWQTGAGTASGSTLGAFDVLGDPVPEPSSVLLTAGGLAWLWRRRRR
jgi:hypothetical protein